MGQMMPGGRVLIGLVMAPAAVLLGACPPIPEVWIFNGNPAEVVMAVEFRGEALEARVSPGRGEDLHFDTERLVHIKQGRCDYAYDLSPIKPEWGLFYPARLEPDFTLKVLPPSFDNEAPPRGDMARFETAAVSVNPKRTCG